MTSQPHPNSPVKPGAAPAGVRRAVAIAGRQVDLARALQVSEAAVSGWVRRGWVPWRRAAQIEGLCGVPREALMDPRMTRG